MSSTELEIAERAEKAKREAQHARRREKKLRAKLVRATEKYDHASDAAELKIAQHLVDKIKLAIVEAEVDREEKEAIWEEAVEESLAARLMAIEGKRNTSIGSQSKDKLLKIGLAKNNILSDFSSMPQTQTKPKAATKEGISRIEVPKLNVFAAYSSLDTEKSTPPTLGKLDTFLSTTSEFKEMPIGGEDYDDWSESFYTDEGYANVKEGGLAKSTEEFDV